MSIVIILLSLLIVAIGITAWMYLVKSKKNNLSQKSVTDLQKDLEKLKIQLGEKEKAIVDLKDKNKLTEFAGSIVTQIPLGLVYINSDGVISFANPYAEHFLQNVPAIGKTYQETVKLLISGKPDYSYFNAAYAGRSQTLPGDSELITGHGNVPITGTVIALTIDGSPRTVLFAFDDDSKNISRIQEEKEFFSSAAHELRTPLTAMHLLVYTLLQQFDTLGHEKIIDYLKKTNDATEYMTNLVNDFLNLSRLEQGRLAFDKKSFNLITLTDEVIKELTPLARQKHLFIMHEPVEGEYRNVAGDPVKTKEILTNLINNSIKYTVQGGITISHSVTNTSLITKIRDTGGGIPKESQELLFKRFMQVGHARQQASTKGSGLGLYISKKIAQLMNGDVALESSEPGSGSVFTFTMPFYSGV